MEYKLSPSDLTFLYDGCKHCFVLKVKHGIFQPSIPIPAVFTGLLYFSPDSCELISLTRQALQGNLDWIEIPRDDESFRSFLQEVVQLLDGPLPPSDPDNCNWCAFIKRTRKLVNKTQDTKTSTEPAIQVPSCPQCSGPMQLRTGKFGEFWSCLKFPDCKGTRNK
jgi:hypothetical protein